MAKITSIIEYQQMGCTVRHKKRVSKSPNADQVKPHDHEYKSEATSDKNRLFHRAQAKNQGAIQTTTVTVNVNEGNDCLTGCFSALAKLFKPA